MAEIDRKSQKGPGGEVYKHMSKCGGNTFDAAEAVPF
jgi:hypothetical protein